MGSSSIIVEWKPIPQGSRKGQLIGYIVRYQQTSSNGSDGEIKILSLLGHATKANLTQLQMASTYKIEVAGETTAGIGIYSEPVTAKTCKFKTA